MKKLLILICTFIALGCVDNGNWEIVKGDIDDEQFPNDEIYFQSPDSGIFCGSSLYEVDKANGISHVVRPRIMMTITGGKNWVEIPTPSNVSGTIFKAAYKDSNIVCLIGSTIYKTNNLGRNWSTVFPSPVKPYHLNLLSEHLAYFIFSTAHTKYLCKYENGQVDTVHSLLWNREYRFSNGSLYAFPSNDDRVAQEITEESLFDGLVETYRLPHPQEVSFVSKLKQQRSIIVADYKLITIDSGRISITYPTFLKTTWLKRYY